MTVHMSKADLAPIDVPLWQATATDAAAQLAKYIEGNRGNWEYRGLILTRVTWQPHESRYVLTLEAAAA